jgi:uncharacterized protein YraI
MEWWTASERVFVTAQHSTAPSLRFPPFTITIPLVPFVW